MAKREEIRPWRRWGLLLILAIRWQVSGTRDQIAVQGLSDRPLGPKTPRREAFIVENGGDFCRPPCLQEIEDEALLAPMEGAAPVQAPAAAGPQPKMLNMKTSDFLDGGLSIGAVVEADFASRRGRRWRNIADR